MCVCACVCVCECVCVRGCIGCVFHDVGDLVYLLGSLPSARAPNRTQDAKDMQGNKEIVALDPSQKSEKHPSREFEKHACCATVPWMQTMISILWISTMTSSTIFLILTVLLLLLLTSRHIQVYGCFDLTCKHGSVGQSKGLAIPRSSVRFRLKPAISNFHGFELHRHSIKGTKLLLKVIKAIIIISQISSACSETRGFASDFDGVHTDAYDGDSDEVISDEDGNPAYATRSAGHSKNHSMLTSRNNLSLLAPKVSKSVSIAALT